MFYDGQKQNQWLERGPDFEPTSWPVRDYADVSFPKTKLKVPTMTGLVSKRHQPLHNSNTLDSIYFSLVSSLYVEVDCQFNQRRNRPHSLSL